MAYVLGVWRLASDMSLMGEFPYADSWRIGRCWPLWARRFTAPRSCSAATGGAGVAELSLLFDYRIEI